MIMFANKEPYTIKVLYCVNGTFVNKNLWLDTCKKVEAIFTCIYSKSKSTSFQKNKKIILFNLEF